MSKRKPEVKELPVVPESREVLRRFKDTLVQLRYNWESVRRDPESQRGNDSFVPTMVKKLSIGIRVFSPASSNRERRVGARCIKVGRTEFISRKSRGTPATGAEFNLELSNTYKEIFKDSGFFAHNKAWKIVDNFIKMAFLVKQGIGNPAYGKSSCESVKSFTIEELTMLSHYGNSERAATEFDVAEINNTMNDFVKIGKAVEDKYQNGRFEERIIVKFVKD